jgi:outer membrane protein OmpA-like peptidoglycan-associated protein
MTISTTPPSSGGMAKDCRRAYPFGPAATNWQCVLAAISMTLLAACAHLAPAPARVVEDRFNMHYDLVQGRAISLSNVFDDHRHTYLQFRSQEAPAPVVVAQPSRQKVVFVKQGNYWVADGVFTVLAISAAGKTAVVTNQANAARITATPSAPQSPALQAGAPALPLPVEIGRAVDPSAALTVHFSHRQSRLEGPARAKITTFARTLPANAPVVVTGYTASVPMSAQAQALAIARATAVREALTAAGVHGSRIETRAASCPPSDKPDPRWHAACQRAGIAVSATASDIAQSPPTIPSR